MLAIDPFEHFSTSAIAINLGIDSDENDKVKFIEGFSSNFRARDIVNFLPGKAQFISLDGSHDAVDVLEDLKLAHEVIHPKGIVALDDFLNTQCLGVLEATCRFLELKPGLIPFLFTSGKLFFGPTNAVKEYYAFVERFAASDLENPQSVAFTAARAQNKAWGETEFFGYPVLVV